MQDIESYFLTKFLTIKPINQYANFTLRKYNNKYSRDDWTRKRKTKAQQKSEHLGKKK